MSSTKRKNPRMLALGVGVGLLGLLLGGGLIFWACSMISSSKQLAKHGVRSQAVLVEKWIDEDDLLDSGEVGGRQEVTCHFKVRYTPDGVAEAMTADLFIPDQFYDKYETGQDVGVVYLPDDPSEIEAIDYMENASGSVIGPVIMMIFGLLLIGLTGVGGYIFIMEGVGGRIPFGMRPDP